jgi:hypothetical protein
MSRRPPSRPLSRPWSVAPAAWLACVFAGPAAAQYATDYTYVKMSLTVPWTLYFVFLAGVLIPFVVMILKAGHGLTLNRFLRYVLPVLVLIVLAVVAVFVYNAFEVMHLMETEKRAGPTILSR